MNTTQSTTPERFDLDMGRHAVTQVLRDAAPDPEAPGLPTEGDLYLLAGLAHAAERIEAETRIWVHRARSLGYSWAQIGNALGTTKQAAHQRFARACGVPACDCGMKVWG